MLAILFAKTSHFFISKTELSLDAIAVLQNVTRRNIKNKICCPLQGICLEKGYFIELKNKLMAYKNIKPTQDLLKIHSRLVFIHTESLGDTSYKSCKPFLAIDFLLYFTEMHLLRDSSVKYVIE